MTVNAEVPGDQPWNTKTIATGVTEFTVPAESDPLVPVQVKELVLKPISPAK